MARREERRREERRLMRAAQRAAVRKAYAAGSADPFFDRHRFPCAYLCNECGRMRRPADPTAGDPQRRPVRGSAPLDACPHCRNHSWVDLQFKPHADMMRDDERREARRRKSPVALAVFAVTASLLAGTLLDVYMPWSHELSVGGTQLPLYTTLAVALTFVTAVAATIRSAVRRRRTLPRRWLLPPRPRGQEAARVTGIAKSNATLSAPLSSRCCVAYELAIHTKDAPEARLGDFLLVEQRTADIAVNGLTTAGDRTHLQLHRKRFDFDPQNKAHLRLLNSRGLEPEGEGFVVYETIIEPDAPVELTLHSDGAALRAA